MTATETEEGRRWAESRIKALTGGDRFGARFMRQDDFEFLPHFKLMIAGNHKPGLRSVDEAIRRRFNFVPFVAIFPPEERDPELAEKLKDEWPASWPDDRRLHCVAAGGASTRPQPSNATAAYLESQDALAAWIQECCEQQASAFETRSALFNSWSAWANAAGEHIGTRSRFLDALEARGFRAVKAEGGSRGFRGLRIIPKPTTPHWSDQ